MNQDPLEILKNPDIIGQRTTDFTVTLSSLYALALAVGTIGILYSIVILGFKIVSAKSGTTRDEIKKEFFWKCVLGVLLFAFTGIIALIYTLSKDFIPT